VAATEAAVVASEVQQADVDADGGGGGGGTVMRDNGVASLLGSVVEKRIRRTSVATAA
jgi:hypothetical protein